ncbi:MAG TPA: MFS transporter, partial [Pseudonocardia sp.]|nr:MFS transporter [Pseudonocardia sp.]
MTTNALPEQHASGTLADTLDRIGFSRAQLRVLILILAGMFFDTLEQNSVGAMGANLKLALGITDTQLTVINTATVVGGLVGRLVGGWLADRYGRRTSLSANLLIYTLGGVISALAVNHEMLLASRFIVGIGLGGEFTIGIAMLSEMVATRHRGALVATLNIGSGGVGNFLSYGLFFLLLGPLAPTLGGDRLVWRWSFLLLAAPALLVVTYRRRLPETPRFLLSTGRVDEANRSLAILGSDSLRPPSDAAIMGPLTAADIPPRQLRSSPWAVFDRCVLSRTLSLGAASWMAFGAQVTLNFLMPTLLVEHGYSISQSLLFTMIMN